MDMDTVDMGMVDIDTVDMVKGHCRHIAVADLPSPVGSSLHYFAPSFGIFWFQIPSLLGGLGMPGLDQRVRGN